MYETLFFSLSLSLSLSFFRRLNLHKTRVQEYHENLWEK